MNGVKEFYRVKLKQTSKGIWYCDGLDIEHEEFKTIKELADQQMSAVERLLCKHNDTTVENKPEKK